MPLTNKGASIMKKMRSEYGDKKGESVFYASKNAGKISGVEGCQEEKAEAVEGFTRKLQRRSRKK